MPPTRQIGKRVLAFKWSALAFTALATAGSLLDLQDVRNSSHLVNSLPRNLLPINSIALPHTVSHLTVGLSLLALGVIVAVQLALLAFTQLGRRPAVIAIGVEIVLWLGICLANYGMQRGYRAAVSCAGPPTHCSVTYPSVFPALLAGLLIGAIMGAVWRVVYTLDQRKLLEAPQESSAAAIVEQL